MSETVVKKRPNPRGDRNYKGELDKVASRAKEPPEEGQQGTGIVDKVSQYVPAVGKVLGSQAEPERPPSPSNKNPPGPPNRPADDVQVEEFIRDQHHSKQVVGFDEPTQT